MVVNISKLSQEERVYKLSRSKSSPKILIRSEQKNTAWKKKIVHRFTKTVSLVSYASAETFFAKVYILI